ISAPKGMNKGFDSQSGYAIGDYVGFDDNVSMVRKGFKGTGSSLAIPAWLAQARAVAEVREFGNMLDLLDLDIQATGKAPVCQQDKYARYLVSKRTGLPLPGGDEDFLRSQAGTYTEDLSDELVLDAAEPDPAVYSTVLIREE